MKSNPPFTVFTASSCRGIIRRDASSPQLRELLHDPGRAFTSAGSVLVKDSKTASSCTLPVEMAGGASELFVKRYHYQNSLYALKHLFRSSRAKRAWKTAHDLLLRNIPTPLPVAYIERRRIRLLRESFFITLKVDHAVSLRGLLLDAASGAKGEHAAVRQALVHQTALLIRTMHDRGIWHRDLKATNILAQRAPGNGLKLYLTDLDSVRIKDSLIPRARIRDLARLNASLLDVPAFSLRDRLRFLHSYLNTGGARDTNLRAYWEAIGRETLKKLASRP